MKPTLKQILPLTDVQIQDHFWSGYIDLVKNVVVPYQWEALNDRVENAEPSGSIRNFKISAGEEKGDFFGMVFQDSDVAKWLEAVSYLLTASPDPELEHIADGVIDLLGRAQHEDGYLNTYYTIKEPGNRWTNLCECHELYCAGHLIEAGVAYFQATGKRKVLDIICKFADHIADTFGPEPGQIKGYDGHQEIELALMKLYEVTENEAYLNLCRFFLEERGSEPHFYDIEADKRNRASHWDNLFMVADKAYSQAHKPVLDQEKAIGHAVRFAYMCAGMAHLAAATGDEAMLSACKRLWENMSNRQMYITGAIGSQSHGEAFTVDYDLPNDTVYAETCASIGMIFFAQRMLQADPDSKYADVMERALYNTVIGGMSQDGKSFFYVNPLEVHPEACRSNHIYHHVKPVRQGWFGCACCPPNIARLLASLGQYIYTVHENTIYTNLYIGSSSQINIGGKDVTLEQRSDYPWNGDIKFTIHTEANFTLALRLPDWCDQAEAYVNGVKVSNISDYIFKGYIQLEGRWNRGDTVELKLSMPVMRIKGHPMIRQTAGKVALQRGPLVYCMEEADNGPNLHNIALTPDSEFTIKEGQDLFKGVQIIEASAVVRDISKWGDALYKKNVQLEAKEFSAAFIPYYTWANRGIGEMRVWIEEWSHGIKR